MSDETPGGNRLADAGSAYLRSAAHQPVDWRPWGPGAFREARERDVPVLLDVGAAWCHWCHVMDHESYEDPMVAELVNGSFVPVKVDRDERPDVDARYQRAVQALTGRGGWPLTAFLTPEGRVFYGGTYFPPEDRRGQPGFPTVLRGVSRVYQERRGDAREQAERVAEALRRAADAAPGELALEDVEAAVADVVEATDAAHGGFGGAPKFPMPAAVDLLLWAGARGNADARDAAVASLDGMAAGGIRDHLGGGFHRYSVDARWHVPHFEKLADGNADLLATFLHGYQATGDEGYRDVVLDVARWFLEVLRQPDGTFGASQDADAAPGDDGDHWTWTVAEMREALDDDHAAVALRAFEVEPQGDMRHDPARNVLQRRAGLQDVAEALGLHPAQVAERLTEAREALLGVRNERSVPPVDPTAYVDRNAQVAAALLEAGPVLGEPDLVEAGLATLATLTDAWDGTGHAPHRVDGEGPRGLLGDAVHLARAHLAAHDATLDGRHVDHARRLLDHVLDHHRLETGALADLSHDAPRDDGVEPLAEPHVPVLDQPDPGLNPRAATGLLRLHHLTGDVGYRDAARGILEATAGRAREAGVHAGAFHLAVAALLAPAPQVVLVGPRSQGALRELHRAALAPYAPGRVVLHHDPATGGHVPPAVAALLEAPGLDAGPAALVCAGDRCFPPTSDPREVRERVAAAVRDHAAPPKP